jgi:two-component system response regulator DesR
MRMADETRALQRSAAVVVVDDNPLVVEALRRRIALESDLTMLGSLNERDDIMLRLAELRPDVVLLDIDIPGVDGFELVRQLGREQPGVRVVMFTGHAKKDYFEQALASGAWGFVLKSAPTQYLLDAVRRVSRGEVVITDADDPDR